MSEQQFIRSTAPTLAGLKTGSLFPYRYSSKENALAELRAYNRKLTKEGLRLLSLRMTENFALLYFRFSFISEICEWYHEKFRICIMPNLNCEHRVSRK